MSDWLVTVKYDPGTPKTYAVLDAPDRRAAQDAVLIEIGYHPGVDIIVKAWDGKELPANMLVTCLNWRGTPLNAEERELVEYND